MSDLVVILMFVFSDDQQDGTFVMYLLGVLFSEEVTY